MTESNVVTLEPHALQTIRAHTLADRAVPQRGWIVPGYIPERTVTILGGDGGTGKSLLALQLAVAMVTSMQWLALPTMPGKVVFLSAEDELDEIHRRLHQICARREVQLSSLTHLHIAPLAGQDALLAIPDRARVTMQTTRLWSRLREILATTRPRLLVIDTLADVFGGDEINRVQTRAFIGLLRGLALELDLAIVLLAHPSLSGMASGSGSSGSTAWSNSVRSRLYFERVKEDGEDGNGRLLSTKKANYAAIGAQIKVWWRDGVFENEGTNPDPERATALKAAQAKIDALFLKLLTALCAQGRALSPNPSPAYAPRVFETDADAGGTKAKAFANSMNRLLAADMIHIVESGPPSKRRSQLAPGPKPKRATDKPHPEDAQIEAAFSVGCAGEARVEASRPTEQASGN
jgi:RecA-family ATPase